VRLQLPLGTIKEITLHSKFTRLKLLTPSTTPLLTEQERKDLILWPSIVLRANTAIACDKLDEFIERVKA
jgi:hypothetical protein